MDKIKSCDTENGSLIDNVKIVTDIKACPTKHGRVYCKSDNTIGYECIGNTTFAVNRKVNVRK